MTSHELEYCSYSSLINSHPGLIRLNEMTPERWQQVNELFHSALEREPSQRAAFLNQACAGDHELRKEVESLIGSHENTGSFINAPGIGAAAQLLAEESPDLSVGQRIGHYKILSLLGSGGMGEVYLAQDSKLGRKVALKLLPASFTRDHDRVRRFEQEARAASALNHPNILTIFDIEEIEGVHFIATEYIEGKTLREHTADRKLELSEALDLAIQVASALSAAHQAGIVHRDVKPENIMLRPDGYVKVLDFGLAKLTDRRMGNSDTESRAFRAVKTDTGVVMGTARYMSPEQARGLPLDVRTDIFSLGVVLYEMATAHLPFEGDTASHVIVSILEKEPPPISNYYSEAPAELQRIISKALCKAKEERYQVVKDLLIDLKNLKQNLESGANVKKAKKRAGWSGRKTVRSVEGGAFTKTQMIWSAALLLLIGIGVVAWIYFSRPALKPSLPPMKVVPFTSFPGWEGNPAFSPDGNMIAFDWSGEKNDNSDIYVMLIGSEKIRLTTDPANDYGPTWSPDGRQLAFVRVSESEIAIYTVPVLGGPERKLLSLGPKANWGGWAVPSSRFLAITDLYWSPDGKYIACVEKRSKQLPYNIFLFSPETGERRTLTAPDEQDLGDCGPVVSPDSKTVAFVRYHTWLSRDIYLVSVTGGEPRRLTFDNVRVLCSGWTADGREIIFSSERVGGDFSLWRISASGGTPERLPVGGHWVPFASISRQGNRLAYVQWSGDWNIYRIDVSDSTGSGNLPIKLTPSTRLDSAPQYSPDGKKIAFQSDRSGSNEIWMCDTDGSHPVQMTFLNRFAGCPRWSPNGQQIAFDFHAEGKGDIYVISVEGGLPHPVVTDDSDDFWPSWSSDGRWMYFASNRTGESQVWKVTGEGGEAVQVTRQGGGMAFESPDGKYVYYCKDSGPGIWRVPVDGGEETLMLGSFKSENFGDWAVVDNGIYFINPDGRDGVAIEFFNFSSRQVKQIASLGKVDILNHGIAVSPDRRHILYTQHDQPGSDIMLVENFR